MTARRFFRQQTQIALVGFALAINGELRAQDVTPPVVVVSTPSPGSTLSARSLGVITGTAVDNVGVVSVGLKVVRGSDGKFWNGVAGWSSTEVVLPTSFDSGAGTWASTGRLPWLSAGDYTITAVARDAEGHETSAPAAVVAPQPTLKVLNLTAALPAGSSNVKIHGISWDGSVVVGQVVLPPSTVPQAFRWSELGGFALLTDLPGGTLFSEARAVSADGQIMVGSASSAASAASASSSAEATLWNGATPPLGAGDITREVANDPFNSYFSAVSADGAVAAGMGTYKTATSSSTFLSPVRWTAGSGYQELGDLPGGGVSGESRGISADGAIVVGYSNSTYLDGPSSTSRAQGFRWTEATGMVGLADMTPTFTSRVTNRNSTAQAVSADGSTIVGYWVEEQKEFSSNKIESQRFHAVIWNDSGVVPLGQLAFGTGSRYSFARAASGDGRMIVGMASVNFASIAYEAMIWRQGVGMRSLHAELAPYWNLNIPGKLKDATAISADGHTVGGTGKDEFGKEFAWVATLPTVYPEVPPRPKPPLPTAPPGEMLTRTATFTPKVTFTESYTESIKATTEVFEGLPSTFREVVNKGTNSATIIGSTEGIDLTEVDESTEVLVSLGSFLHFATLGEDTTYAKGKTSAVFNLMGFDALGNEISVGTVKYAWTSKLLTVSINSSRSPEYPMAFQDFPALVPATPPNTRSAPFDAILEASIGFAGSGGVRSEVYVTGKVTGKQQTFGSEENAEVFDLMSATMSGSADYTPPVVAFTAPAANLRTTTTTVNLTGIVKDTHLGDKVLVRINGGDFTEISTPIPTGADSVTWQLANLALIPGMNLIEAKSADASGNESALVSRKVTRVAMAPLAVSRVGLGSVTAKFEPTSNREIGAIYTITATPAKGQVFDGWTGIVSSAPKLTFTMTEGLALVANFIPNPFPAIVADYRGLVTGSNPAAVAENGSFTFTPTSTGGFSFKLSLGAASHSVTNIKLSNNGTASFTLSRGSMPPLQITLQVSMDPSNGHVSGTIVSTGLNATFSGDRTLIDAAHPVPGGAYTLLFPAAPPDNQGIMFGSASLVIAPNGVVSVIGRLSDNTSFTSTSNISKDGAIPLYAKIGTGTKTIGGLLQYNEVSGAPEGTLNWLQGGAVSTTLAVIGSQYTPPTTKKRILDTLDVSNGAAQVTLSAGGLGTPIVKTATISTTSAVAVSPAGTHKLVLTILPKLGTFSGSFLPPGATKTVPISGVFFEDFHAGLGVFTASPLGHIRIEAAP